MLKLTFREIRTSFARFLAIFAIIALGSGFFCGLKLTKTCMIHTLDEYAAERRMYDYDLVSTLGFTEEDVAAVAADETVALAEGSKQGDLLFDMPGGCLVLHTVSLPERVNLIRATKGRLPETADECALDGWFYGEEMLGQTITVSDTNDEEDLDDYTHRSFTVVGLCQSPLYINYERGGTSLGSGSITGYVVLREEAYDTDYYTHLYLTLSGVSGQVYSDEYEDFAEAQEDVITALCENRADIRYHKLRSEAEEELADARQELDDAHQEIEDAHAEIEDGKQKLAEAEEELADGEKELELAKAMLRAYGTVMAPSTEAKAQEKLDEGRAEIEEHRQEILDAEEELADAEKKLADAELDYADGVDKLNDLEYPNCFVLDRGSNVGYVCFDSDSEIVNAVAKVFPLFFFAVAALVCITTMTRMVDEQRTQLGVLKALGYSDGVIMGKFLLYSALASILGCAAGIALGAWALPKLIWQAYNIMYGFTDILFAFDWAPALFSSAAYLFCSMLATWYACRSELRETAASLILPRAPKAGKRIFLERIDFIWKRMDFLRKVSVRNIFRYKQRMLMMVLGIGGCTALLLTGYGIRDSIQDVVGYQYQDVSYYDATLNFIDPMDEADRAAFRADFGKEASDLLFLRDSLMDCSAGDITKSAHVVVTEHDSVEGYLSMQRDGASLAYPGEDECVISVGLAEAMGLRIGDTLTVFDKDLGELSLRISGIFTNYVYNYVFLTGATFVRQTGSEPAFKAAWVMLNSGMDAHEAGAAFSGDERIAHCELVEDLRGRMQTMMDALDYIVVVVVVCAGALAFIVLCNLTNISITERLREIATVKVLGFYDRETAQYVFRENIALTVVGALVGIPMGFALHRFVMDQIRIDMVHFDARILPMSIGISLALTLVFGLAVNLAMNPKLRRIDMAQALKSVE